MAESLIQRRVQAMAVSEGAGVTVYRSIGTPALRHLDPFLMLDHFSSDDPNDYIAGFPDHPHRGFITLTYMIDGHMLHQDSMGNRGDLKAGGIQWMKAASGVIHSEMPQQSKGLMRGFQLWINLPAAEKMSDPGYQNYPAEHIPVVKDDGVRVKLISGEYRGISGPVSDPYTQVSYMDVSLEARHTFPMELGRKAGAERNAFIYLFEGSATVGNSLVTGHQLVVLGEGTGLTLKAGPEGARFIGVSGKPLGEPIVQYGPFVMNTQDEIHQAFEDYRNNSFIRAKPTSNIL